MIATSFGMEKTNDLVFCDLGGLEPQYILGCIDTSSITVVIKNAQRIEDMNVRYAENVRYWKDTHTYDGVFTELIYKIIDLNVDNSNNLDRGDQTPQFEENGILPDGSTIVKPITLVDWKEGVRLQLALSHATRQERRWIKRTANEMEQHFAAYGAWVCEWCLIWKFPQSRGCRATRCPGTTHHVKQQRVHEKNLVKLKYNLEHGFPIASHFARMIGLPCQELW